LAISTGIWLALNSSSYYVIKNCCFTVIAGFYTLKFACVREKKGSLATLQHIWEALAKVERMLATERDKNIDQKVLLLLQYLVLITTAKCNSTFCCSVSAATGIPI
jgi:hypothetical protein